MAYIDLSNEPDADATISALEKAEQQKNACEKAESTFVLPPNPLDSTWGAGKPLRILLYGGLGVGAAYLFRQKLDSKTFWYGIGLSLIDDILILRLANHQKKCAELIEKGIAKIFGS